MRNLLKPLKDGRVRLLLNAGDHASMQASLKKCLEGMGIDFKVIDRSCCISMRFYVIQDSVTVQDTLSCFVAIPLAMWLAAI